MWQQRHNIDITKYIYDEGKRVVGKDWYPVQGLKRCNNTYYCKFYDRENAKYKHKYFILNDFFYYRGKNKSITNSLNIDAKYF